MARRALVFCLSVFAAVASAAAQDDPSPPRPATAADLQLLGKTYALVEKELDRIGLHRTVGRKCTTFVTPDSIRPEETPLPLDDGTVTLPYASFLIWSADRPFGDSLLYHVFSPAEGPYAKPITLPAGAAPGRSAIEVGLAKRQAYPTAHDVAQNHETFSGPFIDQGSKDGVRRLTVRPYTRPTQNDDPASVLPRKSERTMQVTCLIDPKRVTDCLCAGTD